MTSLATGFVATARLLVGLSALLITDPIMGLFRIPTSSATTYPFRLFGVRDAVIAGLLWTANTPDQLKRALLAGTLVDGIDLISTCAGFLSGDLGVIGFAWAAGVIVLFLAIQLWTLNNLRSTKGAKIQ